MSNHGPAVMRLAHPLAFSAYLQHIGAPTDSYFQRQKLPSYCQDPNAFVPVLPAWRLFADAARREDRFIGWHVGRYVGDKGLSDALLKKLERAPTLYRALHHFIDLVQSEASQIKLWILESRYHVHFCTQYSAMRDEPGYLVSQAYQIGAYIDLVRHFAGADWKPSEVGIEASEVPPPLKERFPGALIRINQPFGFIAIPRSCLHKKLCRPHVLDEENGKFVDTKGLDFSDTLALLLEPHLSEGYPTMSFSASIMETSTRTMTRRLAECGTNYQALVDELRLRKAMAGLRTNDMSMNDVARSVGFCHQSNFTRMFQRMAGINPLQFRRQSESYL